MEVSEFDEFNANTSDTVSVDLDYNCINVRINSYGAMTPQSKLLISEVCCLLSFGGPGVIVGSHLLYVFRLFDV